MNGSVKNNSLYYHPMYHHCLFTISNVKILIIDCIEIINE